jgi:Sulfotransferase family
LIQFIGTARLKNIFWKIWKIRTRALVFLRKSASPLKNITRKIQYRRLYAVREKARLSTVRHWSRQITRNASRNESSSPDKELFPSKKEMRYTIARIIGNDLYPRHDEGQTLTNLDHILKNEPAFPYCRKVFVLNRIFDQTIAEEAKNRVLSAGYELIEIPFYGADYAQTSIDLDLFGGISHFNSEAFDALSEHQRTLQHILCCAPQIRYAMNINGARNVALDDGREHSEWTILLDGNCFIAEQAFEQLQADMSVAPFAPYVIVPMIRLSSNNHSHVNHLPPPDFSEEPQIAFHCSSTENFDEQFPYGVRDKTSLLNTLGVPGAWSFWRQESWIPTASEALGARNFYKYATTSVFRLSSGHGGTLEEQGSQNKRYRSRNKAILLTLSILDKRHKPGQQLTTDSIIGSPKSTAQKSSRVAMTSPSMPTTSNNQSLRSRTLLVGLGAMKSGTSWLSEYLSGHPDFHHSSIKEVNYFNRIYKNPYRGYGREFRLYRMEEIILNKGPSLTKQATKRLRVLAQLGRINSHEDYLAYFSEYIGNERCFGEISPSYSHIPAPGLQDMASVTDDVRFIFLMRDPTERAASHIQHVRRRACADESIDDIIETITPSSPIFERSNYDITLNAIEKANLGNTSKAIIYETLFCKNTIQDFCHWLGLKYIEPNFKKRINVSMGEPVTEVQKLRIRERLNPIYTSLNLKFADKRPASWRW